ncbi:MAG: MarR family transcriptional regulator [Pigmentiphaga sp.]|uniref:MarR family winged helix-turn-helix transcriptional regulator n=1 Tax=Pigmentiphaga sp. TaxID=1977564 RepID=UPI0029B23BEF|nr:MarR family transcriptional regulator [Pigmentiphaga sp.]MDX3906243.1 MarR family transcriptional regulator [Pigmentiphaga sp.]
MGEHEKLLAPKVATLSKALMRASVQYGKAQFGISQVEWQVITLLGILQPVSIRQLAYTALVDAAQISRAVSGLSKRGLVTRRRSQRDCREAELTLTEEGMNVMSQLRRTALERNARLFEGFEPQKVAELFQALDVLIARAMREEADGARVR